MKVFMLLLSLWVIGQVRPNPYVDVTAYGADPTGVKDSLGAIKAAMTAACATKPSGAIVWFPAGKYAMSASIPNTAALWCNGLTLQGSGIRATQLSFSAGAGYAINYPEGTRNVTLRDFLMVIANNNSLGGIFLGGGNFSDVFENVYLIAPATSTAIGFSTFDTGAQTTAALLNISNFRIDGFGGTGGSAFWLVLRSSGDQLRCTLCYAAGAATGFSVNGWFLASLTNVAADNNSHVGFFIGNNGTTALSSASSEGDTGLAAFFVEGGATAVLECDECKTQSFVGGGSPFSFFNFTGTAMLRNPQTVASSAATLASLDVSSVPKMVAVLGGTSNLDKGMSARAAKIVKVM